MDVLTSVDLKDITDEELKKALLDESDACVPDETKEYVYNLVSKYGEDLNSIQKIAIMAGMGVFRRILINRGILQE